MYTLCKLALLATGIVIGAIGYSMTRSKTVEDVADTAGDTGTKA